MTRKMSISFMAVAALVVGIGLVIAEARAPQHAARLENIPRGAPLADPLENALRGVPLVLISRCEGAEVQLVAVPINGGDAIPIASFDAGTDLRSGPNCLRSYTTQYFSVSVSPAHDAFLYRSNSTAEPPYTSRARSGAMKSAPLDRVSNVWLDDTRVLYAIPRREGRDTGGQPLISPGAEWRSFDVKTGEDAPFLSDESPASWIFALPEDDRIVWMRRANAAGYGQLISSAREDLEHGIDLYYNYDTEEKHSVILPVDTTIAAEWLDHDVSSPSTKPMSLTPDGYRLAIHVCDGLRCNVAIVDLVLGLVEELEGDSPRVWGGLSWDGPDRLIWNEAITTAPDPTNGRYLWNSVVVSDLRLGTTTTIVRASESADYWLRDIIPSVGILIIAREGPTLDSSVLRLHDFDGSILLELDRGEYWTEVYGWIQLPKDE